MECLYNNRQKKNIESVSKTMEIKFANNNNKSSTNQIIVMNNF